MRIGGTLIGSILALAMVQLLHASDKLEPVRIVSELTGLQAAEQALHADCDFSLEYQLWLCEPLAVERLAASSTATRQAALAALRSTGALLIPNSTDKLLMVFDAVSGDLIDPAFIELDDAATGTAIHALVTPGGHILVSDQIRDVVHRYTLEGNYLGVFAPAGGVDTSILDNIRGIALRPNGHLLVTVAASGNANSVAEFDLAGNFVGNFIASGAGGLNAPFDVYLRPGVDWLVSSINSNDVKRYHVDTGAPLGSFAAISSFPQQIHRISNGNVLVANFSGTPGVHEFTAAGAPVGIYAPSGLGGYRGVYELSNGNILASTSAGVYEIDRAGNLVSTKHVGASRFIQYATLEEPSLVLQYTVGTNPSQCATTEEITVTPGTAVTRCYSVTNSTGTVLSLHDLVDSELGVILDGLPYSLTVGSSVFITQTSLVSESSEPEATWTSYNPGPTNVNVATDSAIINVVPPSIELNKTVGLDSSVCATTSEITVSSGTTVTYCFEVSNTGPHALSLHDLVDSELGAVLDGFSFNLMPGASAFITQTAIISTDTTNTATWTAYNPGPIDIAVASDIATVFVADEVFQDRFEESD